ncbi:MFS transporter [Amycolatopsis minnesotensis]|uniref:MFS transporter n=1 Tax=Amycolatopsis minnesotensis TaxID=337894 RepID=A0ABP5BFV5_9PSEU
MSYRRVLAIPDVRFSLVLLFFARLPGTAMGLSLTLHIVSTLGRGYGAAGLVGTATTIGSALGAPVVGRLIDRHGLRPVIALCTVASTAYWVGAPHLPFAVLLVVALPAGMLAVPASSIGRQILTALVPPDRRRAAFSLDTVAVEASFMLGPAGAIVLSTQFSSTVALTTIGCCFAVVGSLLYWWNPPIRHEDEAAHGHARPPLRSWLGAPLAGTLVVAAAAVFVLAGMELAMVAALRETDSVAWTGLAYAVICAASLVGGLIHGAARRSLSQLTLMLLLAALMIPVALLVHPWWLLSLALVPANLACAPTIAATSESVSKLAPAEARGEAMGLQDAAQKLGLALGNPVIGVVLDHSSSAWGFAAAGIGGFVFAAAAIVLIRVRAPQPVG